MRLLAGIITFAVLPRTAAAEVYPVKAVTVGLAFAGYSGAVNGVAESGIGLQGEVAFRVERRTQLVVEGGVASMYVGDLGPEREGRLARGAAGVRWIARSYDFEDFGAIEMALDAAAGANKVWWRDGGTLVRPEVGLGVAIQMRKYRAPHVTYGFHIRVYFAPSDDDTLVVARCTGACEASGPIGDGGMMFGIGASL